jgi:hypothetical protein
LSAHLAYLKWEGVTRNVEATGVFDAGRDQAVDAASPSSAGTTALIFASASFPTASEITDLRNIARDLAKNMEAHLGTRLDLGPTQSPLSADRRSRASASAGRRRCRTRFGFDLFTTSA